MKMKAHEDLADWQNINLGSESSLLTTQCDKTATAIGSSNSS